MAKFARTLRALELYDEAEIAPGLFSARDSDGMLRLHDGSFFRGYAQRWPTQKGRRFSVHCWGAEPERKAFTRHTYLTLRGAERALLRKGVELHGHN
jgi:hypothetical protein